MAKITYEKWRELEELLEEIGFKKDLQYDYHFFKKDLQYGWVVVKMTMLKSGNGFKDLSAVYNSKLFGWQCGAPSSYMLCATTKTPDGGLIADIEHRADEIDAYFGKIRDELKEMSTKYGK
jgi:hypothetical protein